MSGTSPSHMAGPERQRVPGSGYYGLPAMKPSPWSWKVPAYVALVGAGGAAQIIAALAHMHGGPRLRSVVRNGRLLGLASTIAGAPLLIADLKTPQRFLNMLRIWRGTSPMSIGSFLLTSFGALSAATVAAELLRDVPGRAGRLGRLIGDAAQLPAALAGAGMATYTGALLSATSVPLWQAAPRLLTARFGASAFASGAAALSLAEQATGDRHRNSSSLDAIAMLATAAGMMLSAASDRTYARAQVHSPLRGTPEGYLEKIGGKAVGQAAPLVLLAANMLAQVPSRRRSMAASVAILAGSLALRHALMKAEKRSARSPGDYLRLASEAGAMRRRLPGAAGSGSLQLTRQTRKQTGSETRHET